MSVNQFSKAVAKWVAESQRRVDAVAKDSAQTLAIEMQKSVHEGGRLPKVTGNLQRSFVASFRQPTEGRSGTKYAGRPATLTVAQWNPGKEPIYFGFQANYAKRLEYGFAGVDSLGRRYSQQGYGFVAQARGDWPQIVKRSAAKIMKKVGS